MKLKVKVTFRQYLKLLFGLAYEKPMMRFLLLLAFLIALWILFHLLGIFDLPEPAIYQYSALILILSVQPFIIYTTIRKNYESSNHLRETVNMELTETEIKIRSESFYMEILWTKIYKLVEKKNWFLVYENNLSAIIIPKKNLTQGQEQEIRKILEKVPPELKK